MTTWIVKGRRGATEVVADHWHGAAQEALGTLGFTRDRFPSLTASPTRDGGLRVRDGVTGALLMDCLPLSDLLDADDLSAEDLQTEERPLEECETEEVVRTPAALTIIPDDNWVMPGDEELPEDPDTLELDRESSLRDAAPADLAEMLFDLGDAIAAAPTLQAAAERALELLRSFVPAESGSVLFAGVNDTSLRFLAADGPFASELGGVELPLGEGVAGRCFDSGATVVVRDAQANAVHLHEIDDHTGYRPQSVLATAIRDGEGRTWGCIELLHRADEFQAWHVQAAEGVALVLANRFSQSLAA